MASNNPNASKAQHSTGTANAQAISFYAGRHEFEAMAYVTLSSAYTRVPPAGFPDANPGMRGGVSPTAGAKTIASGTRLLLYSPEAAALVAAGAAAFS